MNACTRLFSAGLLCFVVGMVTLFAPSARPQANVQGQWQTLPYTMPINPIHVALLHTGNVLIVSGSGNVPTNTSYMAGLWDPQAGTITTQPLTWDMFCEGHIVLPDGRVFIAGGTIQYDPFFGQLRTSIYDPATNAFTDQQEMAHGRWYPTTTVLGDGRVMVFSGTNETGSTNTSVEIYTVGSGFGAAMAAPWTPPLYPRLHVLPNGTVFFSGSTPTSSIFNPSSNAWTTNVATTNYGGTRMYGSSVLLPLTPANSYKPKVMIFGGGNPSTATTEIIDLSASSPKWVYGPSMSEPRIEMDATLLPNGKVLASGGSLNDEDTTTASLNADMYDPTTNTFSSAGSDSYDRLYHSVTLLMPDATVWVAGGNPERGTYEPHMEIYSPPYLFNSNGTLATRPSITSAPSTIGYGSAFTVQTPNAASISSVVLMRNGSSTHAFDMDQRYVGLAFTAGSGILSVTGPPNGNIAPPGYYMMFILNSSGVPSIAAMVQVSSSGGVETPTGTITSPSSNETINAGQSVSYAGSGTSPDGTITGYSWTFPGGTPSTSNLANPGSVTYSTAGTYTSTLTVTDSNGQTDPHPPTRTITVLTAGGGGGGGTAINFGSGFTTTGMQFNGHTKLNGTRLQLTDTTTTNEVGSAFWTTPVNVQTFTNNFTFQQTSPNADGLTFTIQGVGATAIGPGGGGLGYGPNYPGGPAGITNSLCVKFDLYDNQGEGPNSTGLYLNGVSPTIPATTLGGGVNLHSGDIFQVQMTYDGTTLTMTITDTTTPADTFTTSWTVNIPSTVGGNTAYAGFTAGTGGLTAQQEIINWTYSTTSGALSPAATPAFNPVGGTYFGTQSVAISDTTAGATIFYTLDGTTPATSVGGSTKQYTAAISVTASETINAIAIASGFSTSALGTAIYTISGLPLAATPIISPATGTYASSQTVTITDSTAGATIYYTLDNSQPTASSTKYTKGFTVSSTTTVKAIATATSFAPSATATSAITISTGGGSGSMPINFGTGFTAAGMQFNGHTKLNGTRLQLTDTTATNEVASAFWTAPVNVQSFSNDFTFQLTNPNADGFTFTIQGASDTAIGPGGGGLGFGPNAPGGTAGLAKSICVKFDLYDNQGEGPNSTGMYLDGVSPTIPATTLAGGINLHSGDVFQVYLTYDGTTLTLTIQDNTTPEYSFTTSWPVNIPATVGGNTGYVGFTAGTGGETAQQEIITWTYSTTGGAPSPAATPTFNPVGGTYSGTHSVTISDTTSGATIFYTLDGTTPATTVGGSTKQYTAPISVTASETINAIATAAGFSTSALGTAVYTISALTPAATPSITPATGTYTGSQNVTITDSTTGATIYYTVDNSQPSASSIKYTTSFSVNSTTTVKAIATAANFAPSATATSIITIPTTGTPNFGSGFTTTGMQFNGHTKLNGTRLQLTDTTTTNEVGSAFWTTPVNVQTFTNNFTFQQTSPNADGLTFTIQGVGATAIGPGGGGLGYGPNYPGGPAGITNSLCVKFDLYDNQGEGPNSTGLYLNGVSPTIPATTLGGGVNLHSGDIFQVQMTYDGTTLTMTITDTTTPADTFTTSWTVNIPSTVGGNTAYAGFTAGTGGLTAQQEIINWTYAPGAP
jgi:hypothetical protein